MASLTDTLLQQLSGSNAEKIGATVGADPDTTRKALGAAVPLLMAALSRNAAQPEGAASLHDAIERDHDGSVVDNLPGYLDNPDIDDGNGILKHALGGKREQAALGISEQTGLDLGSASKLLALAAPLVIGMLAKAQREGKLDPGKLSEMLGQERATQQQEKPDLMSSITGMLDMNDDGSVMDDLGKLAGGLFGGRKRDA